MPKPKYYCNFCKCITKHKNNMEADCVECGLPHSRTQEHSSVSNNHTPDSFELNQTKEIDHSDYAIN